MQEASNVISDSLDILAEVTQKFGNLLVAEHARIKATLVPLLDDARAPIRKRAMHCLGTHVSKNLHVSCLTLDSWSWRFADDLGFASCSWRTVTFFGRTVHGLLSLLGASINDQFQLGAVAASFLRSICISSNRCWPVALQRAQHIFNWLGSGSTTR
eukprot:1138678-Pelagomonas_calceolata.AAC.13